jgi:SAM-dependent methyltransferase
MSTGQKTKLRGSKYRVRDERGYWQGFNPTPANMIRFERRCSHIFEHISVTSTSTLLEVGCGRGELAYFLAGKTDAKVIGTDISQDFLSYCKNYYNKRNLAFDYLDVTNPNEFAEFCKKNNVTHIVGNGILHHFSSTREKIYKTLHDALPVGGEICFWEPNLCNPAVFAIYKIKPVREYASVEEDECALFRKTTVRKLRNAGFETVLVAYKDFLLPNIPLVLVKPLIALGNILETIPLAQNMSQSLFIHARKSVPSDRGGGQRPGDRREL